MQSSIAKKVSTPARRRTGPTRRGFARRGFAAAARRAITAGLAAFLSLGLGLSAHAAGAAAPGEAGEASGATEGEVPAAPAADTSAAPAVIALPPAEGERFRIAHLTDNHLGSSAGNSWAPRIAEELARFDRPFEAILHAGDLTETGSEAEYARVEEFFGRLGLAIHATPGNHEARWQDASRRAFRERYGEPTRSFEIGGIHFVSLDTSIAGETHGHVDGAALRWLAQDLARVGTERPVVIFAHHPITWPETRFVDNEAEFLEAIAPYHVLAVFTGHGHTEKLWWRNGIPFFMTAAAMDGRYKVLRFTDRELEVFRKKVGGPLERVKALPLAPPASRPRVEILDPAGDARLQSGPLAFQVRVTGFAPGSFPVLEARVDRGAWRPIATAAVPGAGDDRVSGSLDPGQLVPGAHRLEVRARLADGATWTDETRFWHLPDGPIRLLWKTDLGSAVLGEPLVAGSTVAVGTADGRVLAFRAVDGTPLWTFESGGGIAGELAVGGDRLFGATDRGRAFALSLADGRLLWEAHLPQGFVAGPVLAGDRAVFAGDRGGLFALRQEDGSELWRASPGGSFRARPAVGDGAVYAGSWSGRLHAVELADGSLRWERNLATQVYYAPGVVASPLYHQGRVYATSAGDPRLGGITLRALDSRTGESIWQATGPSAFSTIRPFGPDLIGASSGGNLYGYGALTGETRWVAKTGYATYESSPVAFGPQIVFGSLNGHLVAWRPGAEQPDWRFALGDRFLFARAAAGPEGDTLFAAGVDGLLVALGRTGPSAGPPPLPDFRDAAGHWGREPLRRRAASGLFSGYPDGTIRPDRPIRRAELASLLHRYLGRPAPRAGFAPRLADTEGHWAQGAIAALEERRVVEGYPTRLPDGGEGFAFRPEAPVTRAEVSALLQRLLFPAGEGKDRSGDGPAAPTFPDVEGHWAREAIERLTGEGLLTGYPQGEGQAPLFRPDRPITRAEVASVLDRWLSR